LKDLKAKNARLKRMYADLSLVHDALKDAIEKNSKPGREAQAVTHMNQEHRVSIRQGYRAVSLARTRTGTDRSRSRTKP